MTAHDDRPSGEAERLLNHPLMVEILGELEGDALDAVVNTDHEGRRAEHVHQVRAIRTLREKLRARAEGRPTRPHKTAPA